MLLAAFLVVQTVLTRYARFLSRCWASRCWPSCARTSSATPSRCRSASSSRPAPATCSPAPPATSTSSAGRSGYALPEWTIAVVTRVLTFVAALSVGWWVVLPCLLGVPPLVIGLRWYLARAKDGYLRESASYSAINATLTETVEGARTVEALGLGDERRAGSTRHRGVVRAPSATRCSCAPCSSPPWRSPTWCPPWSTLLFGGWLYTRGGSRSATSRPRRSMCRC